MLLLTQWCFWDVTSTSILRPLDPEPAITRLYNEMHFARTEVLLGLTALSALAPVVLFVVGMLLQWCLRKKGSSPETVGKQGRLKAPLGLSKRGVRPLSPRRRIASGVKAMRRRGERGEGPSMGRPVSGVP
ncbi:MAG UNVERIFIED_CONTAM: hypothetical protein LVR18_48895 [Planctomycetaceae bacterium]